MSKTAKISIFTPYNYVFQRVTLRIIEQLNNVYDQLNRNGVNTRFVELSNDKLHIYIEMISKSENYYEDNKADIAIIDPSYFKYEQLYNTFDYLKNSLLNCTNDLSDIANRRVFFLGEDGRTLNDNIIYQID